MDEDRFHHSVCSVERRVFFFFFNQVLGSTVADLLAPVFMLIQHWWHWQILATYRCAGDNVRHTKALCITIFHGK